MNCARCNHQKLVKEWEDGFDKEFDIGEDAGFHIKEFIRNNFLSKQQVREAIKKKLDTVFIQFYDVRDVLSDLLQELEDNT